MLVCAIYQARDSRFCNASVEFNLATLAPTYRLIWRSAGASNALAIAQGLGFDPLVIEEARKVWGQFRAFVDCSHLQIGSVLYRDSLSPWFVVLFVLHAACLESLGT